MRAADVLALAIESLRLHRLRVGLSLLAVGIGATAVLLLTSLGEGAKRYVVEQFASLGTNLVVVLPGRTETTGMGPASFGGATRDLTLDDVEAIRRRAPAVRDVAPFSLGSAEVEHEERARSVYVMGTTANYARLRDLRVAQGAFLPEGDPRRGEPVVVIGSKLKRELFQNERAVGEYVRIAQARFRVIGVLEPKGQSLGVDFDDIAMVPVASGMRLFDQSSLYRIMVQAGDEASIPAVVRQVREVLTDRHRAEDFTVVTQDAMLGSFRNIIQALTLALAAIAAISLAVAGIGIMNVMLVSVSERVHEVGLIKALGGRRREIASLFLVEAVLLSGLGALLGLAFGAIVLRIAASLWTFLPLTPSPAWAAVIVGFSLVTGAAFGLIPARRAARLPAAESLRGTR
jgi:putative ABC transport system permease protein